MKLKDNLIALFALALVAGMGYLWLAPAGLSKAPDITLSTIHGDKITLSQLRGKPVLVNFWATTCPGCIKEMPHLVALYKALAPKGLEIIGIAMPYDPPNQVIALAGTRKIPYPIALDIKGEAAHAFGDVRLTPSNFLIAPDGRIVHQKIGEMDMDKVRAMINDMLARSGNSQTASAN
ncbi:peroxiredoxin [Thiogranum longum]|uniref:Peroxiredoxin n=1 Tax=Thiogranum longum TaxID=1537524 RepID=A0A4R1HPP4_9GAMM|nr:TlpA disulfide reductase family protein [Thiogranum longum]TCK19262.1 peroxiredoxin [Thiogranum longum]